MLLCFKELLHGTISAFSFYTSADDPMETLATMLFCTVLFGEVCKVPHALSDPSSGGEYAVGFVLVARFHG